MSHEHRHSDDRDAARKKPVADAAASRAPEHPLLGLQRKLGNRAVSRLVQRSLGDDLLQAGSQLTAGGAALAGGGAEAGGPLVSQAGGALLSAGASAKVGEVAPGGGSDGGGGMGALAAPPTRTTQKPSVVAYGAPSVDVFQRPPSWGGNPNLGSAQGAEDRQNAWGDNLNAFAREHPEGAEAMIGGGGVHEDAKDQLRWGSLPGSEAGHQATPEEEEEQTARQDRVNTAAGWNSLPFAQ